MAESNTHGAHRAKKQVSKTTVVKALMREVRRLDRFIERYGDLPLGAPEDGEESTFVTALRAKKGGAA